MGTVCVKRTKRSLQKWPGKKKASVDHEKQTLR